MDPGQRLRAPALNFGRAREYECRGPVREFRGVARREHAVGCKGRTKSSESLHGRVGPGTLIVLQSFRADRWIGGHWDRLRLERTGLDGRGRTKMAPEPKRIDLVSAEVELLRDPLPGEPHQF